MHTRGFGGVHAGSRRAAALDPAGDARAWCRATAPRIGGSRLPRQDRSPSRDGRPETPTVSEDRLGEPVAGFHSFRAVKAPGFPVLLLIVPAEMSAQFAPAFPVHDEPSDIVQVSSSPFTEMVPVAALTPALADWLTEVPEISRVSVSGVRPDH